MTADEREIRRKRLVTWDSDFWYGRIGSQMLRLNGLDDRAATKEDE